MRSVSFLAVLSLLVGPATVLGHSVTLDPASFGEGEMGIDYSITVGHDDGPDWKGYADITVTNTSTTNEWGDFHFEITGVTSVIFRDAAYSEHLHPTITADLPWSDQPGVTWSYGTTGDGRSQLDATFYGNPVLPGEDIRFIVYTDNTAEQEAWFGLCFYPTPIPEPTALAMLALGAPLFIWRRRRV
jgi:hypothetical protein